MKSYWPIGIGSAAIAVIMVGMLFLPHGATTISADFQDDGGEPPYGWNTRIEQIEVEDSDDSTLVEWVWNGSGDNDPTHIPVIPDDTVVDDVHIDCSFHEDLIENSDDGKILLTITDPSDTEVHSEEITPYTSHFPDPGSGSVEGSQGFKTEDLDLTFDELGEYTIDIEYQLYTSETP